MVNGEHFGRLSDQMILRKEHFGRLSDRMILRKGRREWCVVFCIFVVLPFIDLLNRCCVEMSLNYYIFMNVKEYKVVLGELFHREQECYSIGFDFDVILKEKVKSIAFVRWSARKKTFYVSKEKVSLHRLYTSLREQEIYVDYSLVRSGVVSSEHFDKLSDQMILRKGRREHFDKLSDQMILRKGRREKGKDRKDTRVISDVNKDVIRGYVSYLRGLRLSESTVMTYFTFVADFVEFVGEKSLDALTNIDVRLFVERQVKYKRYAISTHRQLISAIKHFGRFLPDSNLEVEELPRPSSSRYLPTVLSKEEVIAILRATKNLKHRAIIALLYSAGLRIGEIIDLELSAIDVDRRQLFIKNGKGRKDRVVVLAESFIPLYRNYYMTYTPKRYFIESPSFGKYSAGSIRNFLKRSCKQARIGKHVTPHTLRHSYATHLIENGVGLRYVQDLLGHSKPETTMIYTHVAKKDLLQIQSPLDTVFIALSGADKKQQEQLLLGTITR